MAAGLIPNRRPNVKPLSAVAVMMHPKLRLAVAALCAPEWDVADKGVATDARTPKHQQPWKIGHAPAPGAGYA